MKLVQIFISFFLAFYSSLLIASEDELLLYNLSSSRYVYHCGAEGTGIAAVLDDAVELDEDSVWHKLTNEQLATILNYRGSLQNGAIWGPGIYVGSRSIAAKFKSLQNPVCYEFYLPNQMPFLDLAMYTFEFVDHRPYDEVLPNLEMDDSDSECDEGKENCGYKKKELIDFKNMKLPVFSRGFNPNMCSESIRLNFRDGHYQVNARATGVALTKYDVFYVLRDSCEESIRYRKIDPQSVSNL